LLLGIVLYKVYASCTASQTPKREDSRRWLTEDNPQKWIDSNYDVTQEDEKKSDLPKKSGAEVEGDKVSSNRPKRLHRPSLSA
jgi:hypothetical protein